MEAYRLMENCEDGETYAIAYYWGGEIVGVAGPLSDAELADLRANPHQMGYLDYQEEELLDWARCQFW